jgi:cytoskeletal protein CcmA (bactofilin family)
MADLSVIGQSTVIRGNVRGSGPIEVLGRVEGEVATNGDVLVGDRGVVLGNVSGAAVRVAGEVTGDLTGSDAVLLGDNARVVGDLRAPRIGITEGALVRGSVQTSAQSPPPAQRSAARAAQEPERARPPARIEPAPRRAPPRAPAQPAPAAAAKPTKVAPKPPPPVVPVLSKRSRGRKKKTRAR